MKNKLIILFILSSGIIKNIHAQFDSSALAIEANSKLSFNGYIKDLNSFSLPVSSFPFQYTQLAHNRLNFKWRSSKVTGVVEFRNRIFWGDGPRMDPSFVKTLSNKNESVDLSIAWVDYKNFVLHSNIERLWTEYRTDKWGIKLGRQRINWGMNNSWNPNDIFNSYNMLDFDYEERAGADGLRWHYQKNELSSHEIAMTKGPGSDDITGAIKYAFNQKKYDWQVLAGVYKKDFTIGLGWQGSIGKIGFKGEVQTFKNNSARGYTTNVSTELDYITENGWYLFGSLLFNEQGITKPLTNWSKLNFNNSPANLMPTRWNLLSGLSKEITPIFNARFSFIYSPFAKLLVVLPSLSYGIITNLDVDLFWQSFMASSNGSFKAIGHTAFLRGKWSF